MSASDGTLNSGRTTHVRYLIVGMLFAASCFSYGDRAILSVTGTTMQKLLQLDPATYRTDPRLIEVGFGQWEGFTLAELGARFPDAIAARERDKWNFTPPDAESYAAMSRRMREWYETLTCDTVAVAHGGTFRGLIVQLGIASAQEAPFLDVAQGVVYVVQQGSMALQIKL